MDRVRVAGLPVDALDVAGLLDRVAALVSARGRATVAYVNVHVANVAAGDPALAAFLRGVDVCYADGKGIVWGARVLGYTLPGRMTGADWIHDFCARAEREGWRVAWVGGEPGVTAEAARRLGERYPQLRFAYTDHGYHEPGSAGEAACLAALEAARVDVLLVGMGTPIQERWVEAHRAAISAPVVWCLGATADFVAGRVSRGPAFLHQNQEWLARLLVDPRRLWRRFLLGNPRFFARVLRERFTNGGAG